MKEVTKMKTTNELSSSVYEYVCGVYKGKGLGLGEIASEARIFELEINAFIANLEFREGLVR